MRVGLCQTDIKWEDKDYNIKKAASYLREASMRGVDAVFFPEMSFTGFSMHINKIGETDQESITKMTDMAVNHQLAVGFGWVKLCGDKAENHYTVVDGKGCIRSDYVKIHPFSMGGEDGCFIPGTDIVTFPFRNHTISTFICYDLRFPEPFQAASRTADVIVVAANWPGRRKEHWKCLLQARAVENQSYVLGVNLVGGGKDGESYMGGSMGIDPFGGVLNEVTDTEGLIVCDMKEDALLYRKEFPVKKDRKAELYKKYL